MRTLLLLALLLGCVSRPVQTSASQSLCERADLPSCLEAGRRTARGISVPLDLPAARDLLERCCARGEGAGCEELAAVSSLLGVPVPGVRETLLRGCGAGHGGSCIEAADLPGESPLPAPVAGCREPGWKDCLRQAGLTFDSRACERGDGFACARLEGPEHRERADALLFAGCDKGNPLACEAAGRLSLNDGRTPDGGMRAAARKAFERGCALGDPDACARLANDELGDAGRATNAVERLRRACAQGSAFGCATLGAAEEHGVGTAAEPGRALDALERACALGRSQSCFDLLERTSGEAAQAARRAHAQESSVAACRVTRSPLCERVQD